MSDKVKINGKWYYTTGWSEVVSKEFGDTFTIVEARTREGEIKHFLAEQIEEVKEDDSDE